LLVEGARRRRPAAGDPSASGVAEAIERFHRPGLDLVLCGQQHEYRLAGGLAREGRLQLELPAIDL
jgi:hypothetical protein